MSRRGTVHPADLGNIPVKGPSDAVPTPHTSLRAWSTPCSMSQSSYARHRTPNKTWKQHQRAEKLKARLQGAVWNLRGRVSLGGRD